MLKVFGKLFLASFLLNRICGSFSPIVSPLEFLLLEKPGLLWPVLCRRWPGCGPPACRLTPGCCLPTAVSCVCSPRPLLSTMIPPQADPPLCGSRLESGSGTRSACDKECCLEGQGGFLAAEKHTLPGFLSKRLMTPPPPRPPPSSGWNMSRNCSSFFLWLFQTFPKVSRTPGECFQIPGLSWSFVVTHRAKGRTWQFLALKLEHVLCT